VNRSILLGLIAITILLVGAVTYANADTAIVYGTGSPSLTASSTVTVKAMLNDKLTLTVVTPAASQTVDFGNVDPGTAVGPQAVGLTVQSNRTYDLSKSTVGAAALGLTTSLANSAANARTAGQAFVDNYSINVPWTTAPGARTATVQYTIVQN
jgi:hypothetical protein